MSQVVNEHRSHALASLNLAVLTVSDTRTVESDTSGALILDSPRGRGTTSSSARSSPTSRSG